MSAASIIRFIDALFTVYYILIIVRIIFSWVGIPSGALLTVFRFVYDVTEPYLRIFRRFIPMAGGFDFSPIVAILLLGVIHQLVNELVRSLISN
jgi:YggT family protein